MKRGDILLIHARLDPVAWIIRRFTKSYWNHVAWAVDSTHLIEARGRAIAICPVSKYLNCRYSVKLIRLDNVTPKALNEGIEHVSQFQGKRSYFRYLKTLLRMLFMRYESRIGTITCSGLIARGLEESKSYILPPSVTPPYFISPEDISKTPSSDVSSELK